VRGAHPRQGFTIGVMSAQVWTLIGLAFGGQLTLGGLFCTAFGRVEGRLDRLDGRLDRLDTKLTGRLDALDAKVSSHGERLAHIEGLLRPTPRPRRTG
jgi:hypothetical protein